MNVSIETTNKTKEKISSQKLREVILIFFKFLSLKKVISANFKAEISVVFVGEKKIKDLNAIYRSVAKKTDILSFCYEKKKDFIFGELVVCPQVIKKNAKEDGISFRDELYKNLIHGILHLIGFRHGKKMFSLQDETVFYLKKKL